METVRSSEISVNYQTTQRHILGNNTFQNLKSFFGSAAVMEMDEHVDEVECWTLMLMLM
jgi:hypothetical protein